MILPGLITLARENRQENCLYIIINCTKIIILCLHDKTAVRSGAGTPQMPCSVSGMGQVPRRCPAQCQEWARYPAGALASVRSGTGAPQVPCAVSGVVQKLAN